MRSSSKFFVSIFVGLFFAVIGTAIFFSTVKSESFTSNPQLQIIVGFVLVPSLTVVFTILSYLLLPKNE